MRQTALLVGAAVCAGLLSGCVERRFVVTSDPPGALVLRNNQAIGASPADDYFIYYGDYNFTLIKDGYETLHATEKICTPWYEYFPLDFVSENLVPWTIRDVRRLNFQLTPLQAVNIPELLNQGQQIRSVGQSIQAPVRPPGAPDPQPVPMGIPEP